MHSQELTPQIQAELFKASLQAGLWDRCLDELQLIADGICLDYGCSPSNVWFVLERAMRFKCKGEI